MAQRLWFMIIWPINSGISLKMEWLDVLNKDRLRISESLNILKEAISTLLMILRRLDSQQYLNLKKTKKNLNLEQARISSKIW